MSASSQLVALVNADDWVPIWKQGSGWVDGEAASQMDRTLSISSLFGEEERGAKSIGNTRRIDCLVCRSTYGRDILAIPFIFTPILAIGMSTRTSLRML
ncbi:hypothetical protein PAXINDRAFT_8605 [Paxillus involutus ATCC 200175]|nr:hypothetical protein PAXINDRAFT_8605 [Paxillus involutus ATCC 200175]